MKKYQKDDLIVRCLADRFLPLGLILGFYVILHGNISPGGGFQGGVLVAGAVLMLYLGHGLQGVRSALNAELLHKGEAVGALIYVAFATIGIFFGYTFCRNVLWDSGNIGDLWSSGTIGLMNYAVGFKVLCGIGFLLMLMLGLLATDSDEERNMEGGEAK